MDAPRRLRPSRTPVALLALAAGALAGCTLFTDPRDPRDAHGRTPAIAHGDSAESGLQLRRDLAALAWQVEGTERVGTVTAVIDGVRAEYRALVLEGVVVPSADARRRASAGCPWGPTLLFAWRGRPATEGFVVVGEDFTADVAPLPLFRCASSYDTPARPLPPHVYVLPPGGRAETRAPWAAGWIWPEPVPCDAAEYAVRAAVERRTRLPWDTTPVPPALPGAPRRTLYVVGGSVPGKRLVLRCDDPALRHPMTESYCGARSGR
jgi:hypothetical protein